MFEKSNLGRTVEILWIVGLIFTGLKLCKVIDWSWWWVTLPFWGGISLIVLSLIAAIIYAVILDKIEDRKKLNKNTVSMER